MQIFRFPLVRLSLSFAIGIAIQRFYPVPMIWICFSGAIVLITLAVGQKHKIIVLNSITPLLLFGFLGAACLGIHNPKSEKNELEDLGKADNAHVLQITTREKLKVSDRYRKYICTVEKVDGKARNGKILLYLRRDKVSDDVPIGRRLIVVTRIQRLRPMLNPAGFDYSAYLKNKGIFAQVFTDKILYDGFRKDAFYYSDKIRKRIIRNVSNGFGKREIEVFHALMLGQQQEIDAGIVMDYQATGVVHILSVSGLHVGFVMLILSTVLKPLPNSGHWRTAKLIAVILGLWVFAMLAGLSPPVLRSATTFSFLALGSHLKKGSNIYNTLAVSLLILLVFNPKLLFDVGFQLSYAALFFIVFLKTSFDNIFPARKKVVVYFRDILTVSLAAQIGTLPLSLYYFHQFPGLFLVANLVAIPLLGLIMALGLITLSWACIMPIPEILSNLTSNGISLLNYLIGRVARLDGFVFTDIWFPLSLMVASYFLLFAISSSVKRPVFSNVAMGILSLLAIQFIYLNHQREQYGKTSWIVMHTNANSLILERSLKQALVFQKKANKKEIDFVVKPFAMENRLATEFKPWKSVHFFNDKRILILDSLPVVPKSALPQIVILTNSSRLNLDRLIKDCRPEIIIADGSNYTSYVQRWKRTCEKQKIPFHATAEKGYYCLKDDR